MAHTLYQKLWDSHIVHEEDDGTTLLYIDRHLIHEVADYRGVSLDEVVESPGSEAQEPL